MVAVQGALHHLLRPLHLRAGELSQFAQLYIIDDQNSQFMLRLRAPGDRSKGQHAALDEQLLWELPQCLHDNNGYVR